VVVGAGIPADGSAFISLDVRPLEQLRWSACYPLPVLRRSLNVSCPMDVQSVPPSLRWYPGKIEKSEKQAD